MTTDNKKSATWWPYAIVLAMTLFMGYITMFVYRAMNQEVDLVSKDYYEQEIQYQDHIDKVGRTHAAGGATLTYTPDAQTILLQLPSSLQGKSITGSITLFRPSDDKLDRQLPLQPGRDLSQLIETKTMQPGLWKVRVNFTAAKETYYTEETIRIK